MNRILKISAIALGLASLFIAPASQAQRPNAAAAAAAARPADGTDQTMTQQDKEFLAITQEFSAAAGKIMEDWVKTGKISEKKLMSFFYVPIPDTDPPKFNTDYDKLSDADLGPLMESVLAKSPELRFAVVFDKNGYVPTHNQKFSKPLTGNKQVDLANSRQKRIYNDITGWNAGRNLKPFLIQTYKRDTGEILRDLSVPVYVLGKHWGCVRIAYAPR
jgi:methyl-accepting chemotaxis protein